MNGGAAEVAKVFLSAHKLMSNNIQMQLQMEATKVEGEAGSTKSTAAGELLLDAQKAPSVQDLTFEDQRMRAATTKLKVRLCVIFICVRVVLVVYKVWLIYCARPLWWTS